MRAQCLPRPHIARTLPDIPNYTPDAMLTALALAALIQVPAPTQELAPGTRYDPSIPTLAQVVGHDFRKVITPPDQVIRYMEALAEAAPERTHLFRYAESWEGRLSSRLSAGRSCVDVSRRVVRERSAEGDNCH